MRDFYILTFDSGRDYFMTVADYQINDFDVTLLWGKGMVEANISESVKLFVNTESVQPADLIGNPISWHVCSERLISAWFSKIKNDVQLLKAPLYDLKTKEQITGFQILNPIKSLDVLDREKSTFVGSMAIDFVVDRSKIPDSVNIFRPIESSSDVIVSEELPNALIGKGYKGIAFIKCS